MNRIFVVAAFAAGLSAWACSGADDAVPAAASESASPSDPSPSPEPAAATTEPSDQPAPDASAPKPKPEAGAPREAGADAAVDAGPCTSEVEPNDVASQPLARLTCGKLTAGDVDRFYVEGRKDEAIQITFEAESVAHLVFTTNAGLEETYDVKSLSTSVRPGDRKLFIQVSQSAVSQSYRIAFDRK